MDKTITNTQGVYGYSDLDTRGWQLSMPATTRAAVEGPAVVELDDDLTVATAATDGTASLARGIVVGSHTANRSVNVVVGGVVADVPVDGAVAKGAVLKRSTTTAGRLQATATPAVGERLAIALAASASNVCDVFVVGLGT